MKTTTSARAGKGPGQDTFGAVGEGHSSLRRRLNLILIKVHMGGFLPYYMFLNMSLSNDHSGRDYAHKARPFRGRKKDERKGDEERERELT